MSDEPNLCNLETCDIIKVLKPLEPKWHKLGIHLKIKAPELNRIEANHSGTVERRFSEVILGWQANEEEQSWDKLAEAVESVGGYDNVVRELRIRAGQSGLPQSDQDDKVSGYGSSSASASDSESDIFDTTVLSPAPGCGCEKQCDVYKMCTEGCPQPDYKKSLPILTLASSASESAIKRLSQQQASHSADSFKQETISICEHFGSLVSDTCISLKKQTVKAVALHLRNSFPILKRMKEMSSAKEMEDLFMSVTDQACSWFNFRIIENLINRFGDENDKKGLAGYQKHFQTFAKQRLPPGMKHIELGSKAGLIGCKKLVIKVDREWESITIAELERLCDEFARVLGINAKNLYLADVNKGCIMLTLMLPQNIADKLSESGLTIIVQKQMLADESVIRLTCGRLRWFKHEQPQTDSGSENEAQQDYKLADTSPSDSEQSPVPVSDSDSDTFDRTNLSPGCGCGQCSVYKMCTEGCPKPDYTKRLPILIKFSGCETTTSESEELAPKSSCGLISSNPSDVFEKETAKIREHFNKLVANTCESLSINKDKDAVAPFLLSNFPILKSKADEIDSSKDMTKLFAVVTTQACSWFNFNIIEQLIKQFGSVDDHKRLAQYKRHFKRFAKQRLPREKTHVKLGSIAGMFGCKSLVIKVDRDWELITIAELNRLCREFAKVFGIEHKNLFLADVHKGCVELTFMIPQANTVSVCSRINQLTDVQKQMLENENVMWLDCGDQFTSLLRQTNLIKNGTMIKSNDGTIDKTLTVNDSKTTKDLSRATLQPEMTQTENTQDKEKSKIIPPDSLSPKSQSTNDYKTCTVKRIHRKCCLLLVCINSTCSKVARNVVDLLC